MITTLTAVVAEVNILISFSFCQNPDFWLWFGASKSDSNPLSSWYEWQNIDIMPWNHHQSIELALSFLKRHSSPSYYYYKLRYQGLGGFGGNSSACDLLMAKYLVGIGAISLDFILHWISFQMSHSSPSNDCYKPRYEGRRYEGQGRIVGEFGGNSRSCCACDWMMAKWWIGVFGNDGNDTYYPLFIHIYRYLFNIHTDIHRWYLMFR